MSELRWILVVFAVLLLVGIYGWERRRNSKRSTEGTVAAVPPAAAAAEARAALAPTVHLQGQFAADGTVAQDTAAQGTIPDAVAARIEPVPGEPIHSPPSTAAGPAVGIEAPASATPVTKILALRLVATAPRFSGAHLRTVLESEGLAYGKYQIFHRTTPAGAVVFSVASMVEPGSFDLEQMFHEQYPGIALFAQLSAAVDGMSVLNDLIGCARNLQQTLGGVLLDGAGTPLLASRIEQLRREVREFEAATRSARPRSEPFQS